jgi:O-methyltransferase
LLIWEFSCSGFQISVIRLILSGRTLNKLVLRLLSMVKRLVSSLFNALGYEVSRKPVDRIAPANFQNLITAYEQRLKESGVQLVPNELRTKLLGRLLGTPPSEAYFLIAGLAQTAAVLGDVCEFGVAQGETSALIANEILAGNKKLHLFDSFQGLPKPTAMDQLKDDIFSLGSMDAYAGTMSCPEDLVLARMKAIRFPADRYVIHKGYVDQVFQTDQHLPAAVSFAYVDFDFYEPIKDVLQFLDKVTSGGSVIVVDDYDYFSTGVKTAVDEFVAERNKNTPTFECIVPDKQYGCFAVLKRLA